MVYTRFCRRLGHGRGAHYMLMCQLTEKKDEWCRELAEYSLLRNVVAAHAPSRASATYRGKGPHVTTALGLASRGAWPLPGALPVIPPCIHHVRRPTLGIARTPLSSCRPHATSTPSAELSNPAPLSSCRPSPCRRSATSPGHLPLACHALAAVLHRSQRWLLPGSMPRATAALAPVSTCCGTATYRTLPHRVAHADRQEAPPSANCR